jgi:hypothetical protein
VLLVPGATGAFGGGTAGQVYEYIGTTRGSPTSPVGLRNENYLDTSQWRLVTVGSKDIIVDAQNTSTHHLARRRHRCGSLRRLRGRGRRCRRDPVEATSSAQYQKQVFDLVRTLQVLYDLHLAE